MGRGVVGRLGVEEFVVLWLLGVEVVVGVLIDLVSIVLDVLAVLAVACVVLVDWRGEVALGIRWRWPSIVCVRLSLGVVCMIPTCITPILMTIGLCL